MPYKLRKVSKKKCYRVTSKKKGKSKLHSKCTSKTKAKKQIRLLNAIDHGFIPRK